MLRAMTSLIMATTFLCAANAAQGQTASFEANPESTRHGIKALKMEKQGKVLDINVMGEHRRMAKLIVEFDTPEGTLLDLEHGKHKLRMTWSQQTGRFTLAEKKTSAFVARVVSINPSKKLVTEGDASLIEKYRARGRSGLYGTRSGSRGDRPLQILQEGTRDQKGSGGTD